MGGWVGGWGCYLLSAFHVGQQEVVTSSLSFTGGVKHVLQGGGESAETLLFRGRREELTSSQRSWRWRGGDVPVMVSSSWTLLSSSPSDTAFKAVSVLLLELLVLLESSVELQ